MVDRLSAAHAGGGRVSWSRQRLRSLVEGFWTHDWEHDPFARGAYSYVTVGGADATAALARPLRRTLFPAGEAVETEFAAVQTLQPDDVESGHMTPGQEVQCRASKERLATLEGRIQEQAVFMADVRGSTAEAIRELRRDIDQRFQLVDRRFEQVDQRFEQVDQRFDQIDRRFDRVERLLMWMFGATLTGFTAVMAAAIGSVLRLR